MRRLGWVRYLFVLWILGSMNNKYMCMCMCMRMRMRIMQYDDFISIGYEVRMEIESCAGR